MKNSTEYLRLIAITDGIRKGEGIDELVSRVVSAVRGGATSIQVRLKNETALTVASATRSIVAAVDVPVIVNDRFDIALATGAAGVHVGADDIPPQLIRKHVPPRFIVGTSVGENSEIPNAAFADYVGIGPVFTSPSKQDAGQAIGIGELARLARSVVKPVVAIGGINADNISLLAQSPIAGIAAIGSIFAVDSPEDSTRQLRSLLSLP